MSDFTIYQALRSGGLSDAGACAMMGNMYCESGMRSNNVEDRCALGDFDYTYAVDNGTISRYQWKVDAYGYGLCQWTYPSRKEELYDLAKSKGLSVSDEQLQCEFCITELKRDYPKLYQFLCTTTDISKATEDICTDYERPAINNFSARINAAVKFHAKFLDETVVDEPVANDKVVDQFDIVHPTDRKTYVHLELGDGCVTRGYKPSLAVKAWQNLLVYWGFDIGSCGDDGQFGMDTLAATNAWQKFVKEHGADVEVNGIVDEDDWLAIVEVLT